MRVFVKAIEAQNSFSLVLCAGGRNVESQPFIAAAEALSVSDGHTHSGLLDNNRLALRRRRDRKSTRLNSSHLGISYAVFCLKKKKKTMTDRVHIVNAKEQTGENTTIDLGATDEALIKDQAKELDVRAREGRRHAN